MMKILLIFSLFSVGFSQQLISLSSFKGENQRNDLLFPAPYSIYVSSHSDWESQLGRIYIVNENGTKTSLTNLKYNKVTLNMEFKRYVVQKSSYLTTALSTNDMKNLKGVMFISTPKQVQDDGFHVIDIDYSYYVQFKGADNETILFLNTNTDVHFNPYNSAIISNWDQDELSSVSIYPGIPLDSTEPKNTQIFSNPMHIDKIDRYFRNVEMFSLPMVAFYMKASKGVSFSIGPGYWTPDRKRTMYATTTGFYMKPLSLNTSLVTINTIKDSTYTGASTGANILGHLSNDGTVTVAEYGGASNAKFSTAPKDTIASWSTPNNGNKLSIASTPRSIGQYYVQYYVDQGQWKQLSDRDEKPLQNQKGQHLPEQFKF